MAKADVRVDPLYVDLETAAQITTLSAPTIQTLTARGEFPKQRLLSGRRVGWLYREVVEWAEGRPPADLPPPPNTSAKKPRRGINAELQRPFPAEVTSA